MCMIEYIRDSRNFRHELQARASGGSEYDPQPSAFFVDPQPGDLHNCLTPPPINEGERGRMFGSAVGDSTATDGYDTLEFVTVDKETFFNSANANPAILNLGTANDANYIAEYDSLKKTNIGAIKEVVDSLNNGKNTYALNKLNLIIDQNLIEYNKKYIATLVALNYQAETDADSDTIVSVLNIGMMHPFYGGEAVYWARAMLHLNIIDVLPQFRKSKNDAQDGVIDKIRPKGSVYPNPTAALINFEFKNNNTNKINLIIQDVYGSIIDTQFMASDKIILDVSNYAPSVYFIHVYVNGNEEEVHRFTIIK